jgi:hypothetical protein
MCNALALGRDVERSQSLGVLGPDHDLDTRLS